MGVRESEASPARPARCPLCLLNVDCVEKVEKCALVKSRLLLAEDLLTHGRGRTEPERLVGRETALSAEPLAKFS
jgi:hypothetical protein